VTDLDDIASGLYARPVDEFTAARNDAAKSLEDKALAKEVRALRKPTASAWLLNMMSVHRGDQLGQALQLGGAMREAQEQLNRSELKKLGTQRQQLISALVKDGVALAQELGHPVSAAASLEVEQTLRAAMADAGAAAAVSTGRLVRPLEASGWDPVDLAGAVGGAFDSGTPGAGAGANGSDEPADEPDPGAHARAELEEAEDRSEEAEATLKRARERVDRLDQDREALVSQVRELRKRIRALEQDIDVIDDDADDAVRERTEAERSVREASREVERARKAVDKFRR
jgi:hypothetical protein